MATTETVPKEIAYWDEQYSICKQLREPFERQWYLNLAFFNGKQYMTWTPAAAANLSQQRLQEPPAARHRVRLVDNKIRPIVRTEVAKLTQSEPQWYCKPSTTEPKDITAARVAELITEYVTDEGKYNAARRRSTFWMSICGTGFITAFILDDPDIPCNIIFDDVTPWHMFAPNIQEPKIEGQPYIIRERLVTPESVEDFYGVKPNPSVNPVDQRFLQAIGIRNQASTSKLCSLKDIWVKKCKNYPKGGYLVISDNKVIYSAEPAESNPLAAILGIEGVEPPAPVTQMVDRLSNPESVAPSLYTDTAYPYKHGMFPYAKIDHVPSGGFYCSSVVEDLIPLQRAYNRSRSQQLENQNRTSNPPLFYIRGSIDPSKVTSEPGLQVPVQPGFDIPKYADSPVQPNYVSESDDKLLSSMEDISGQHEITRGRTPPGVEAASAISYLQEQEDSKLHPTVASIEDATSVMGKQALSLVQQYWKPEKIEEVVSKANSQDLVYFMQARTVDSTDIRVETNSMQPRSIAAKRAQIMELLTSQVITPEQALRYMEMNETNRLFEELQVDSKQARRENLKLAQGIPVPVNPWDNSPVHKYEHGLFLKSQEYESLDDKIKVIATNHYMLHEQQELGELYAAGGNPNMGDPNNGSVSGNGAVGATADYGTGT